MTTSAVTQQLPPGPANALEAFHRDPLGVQWKWWQEFGDIWTVDLPTGPMVFLGHPDLVEQLFTNHLDHGEMVRRTIPAQGEGITVQDGAAWRRSRLLMQPMFGRPALRALAERISEAIANRMQNLVEPATTGEPVELSAFLGEVTIRVLFHSMFSDEFSEDEIDFAVRQLDAISTYKGQLMAQAWSPNAPITTEESGARAVAALDELLYNAIDRRRAQGGEQTDLLGRLVAARGDDGEGFTDREIRDQLTVLFFGGYETTQWGVAWALACLAQNPDVLAAVRREIDAVGDRPLGVDDLPALELTRATFDEALRWQSSVMTPRQIHVEDNFAGYTIPAGTIVVASPWVIHRRPDLWDQPERFDPTRFLGDNRKQQHKYQHIPFGGGARTCLGMSLSYMEAQFMLATFLRQFDYEVPADFEPRHRHQYSVVIDAGLPVTLGIRPTT